MRLYERGTDAEDARDLDSRHSLHLMCWMPKLKCPQRPAVLATSWLSALAVVLLLWLYISVYRYDHYESSQPGALLPVSEDGRVPVPAKTTTSATASATMPTPRMPSRAKPSASAPAVTLRQGTYVGTTLLASARLPKAIEAFRGVPYAQDTSGENRFRPPKPLPESTETFDAVAWGQTCPRDGVVGANMGENCLNANIYRPAGLVDKQGYAKDGSERKRPRLPVVVYIHGGGFNTGHGPERNIASFVAWADAPMVAVNFNYRVGALGFLPSALTTREGLLNLGLRDQQMLLEWVRDNIEAFGGDPGNVTIMGLSAGAHSIGHHIMHYGRSSKPPPFAKAILESGATTARAVFYPTHPRHLVQFREFLIAAGAAGLPESDIFPHLRTLPLETIVHASKVVWDKYSDSVAWPFQPVIDGPNPLASSSSINNSSNSTATPLIPDLPINSWRAGKHLRIPVLTGYNTNEGTIFIPHQASSSADFRAFFQNLIPSLTPADLDELEALYPDPVADPTSRYARGVPPGKGRQWARLDAAYAHYAYICPVLQTAHFLSRAGVRNVYVYRYAATAMWGAANHGDEAPVVAHDMSVLGPGGKAARMPGLQAVAREMHGRWARFVASPAGDPNWNLDGIGEGGGEGGKVEWPAFVSPFGGGGDETGGASDGSAGRVLVFGEGNNERHGGRNRGTPVKVEALSELERKACRFWWERVALSEGLGRPEGGVTARAKL
ncbi:hypothetical protein VTK56DRAFT_7489 [Thermocarpiscus australiensis]